ncbi:uncharacterized protein DUF3429 [Aliiruegeria haliotis]|uniref:Uncharacterized protein DUF3429 n=1 Tax=Aliiruegeria haliotis TaxID=1280846 RepID=A0A2T0RGD5_9RHOB|nr:DUF3429 domain-containing protein [Aliiruegeria haliotis]PRY20266.1 uncharacterized protein DUF3429 [Aliiruegeria haliotis]
MTGVPRTALLLGLAGLIPFLWGVLTRYSPALQDLTLSLAGPRFVAPYILLYYGTIILAFMSGVLWGMATRADGEVASLGYALSVIPAIWAFLFTGTGPVSSAGYLIAGFLGVLGIDWFFWRNGLAPSWWMTLRVPLTAVVVLCLGVVVFG